MPASCGDGSYVCGLASGGINIVKLMLSPPISLTYSPIIGVVANTLSFSVDSEAVSSTTGNSSSAAQENITSEAIIKLTFNKFLNINFLLNIKIEV